MNLKSTIVLLGLSLSFSSCFLSKKSKVAAETAIEQPAEEAVEEAVEAPSLEAFVVTLENATTLDFQKGQQIFMQNCSGCHGKEAQGNFGPNLVDAHALHNPSFANVKSIIANGIPNTKMPAYASKLSENDIARVAVYLNNIFGTTPENPKKPQGKQW